jgi:arginine utilization protein RocB
MRSLMTVTASPIAFIQGPSPCAGACEAVASAVGERFGIEIGCAPFFAGISDMNFFGEGDETALGVVARNTPMWRDGVRWPEGVGLSQIPTVNAGPWGRDYHTPLERMRIRYGFEVLPNLVLTLLDTIMADYAQ